MGKRAKTLIPQRRHIYHPELEQCPHCAEPLRTLRHYQWRKTIQHLDTIVYVASQARECANPTCAHCGQVYPSAAAQMLSLAECTYGLDVIAQVGQWKENYGLSRQLIHRRLVDRGLKISERQIDYLYTRYQALLQAAEQVEVSKVAALVRERGGALLSIAGLELTGITEQLWIVREVQTNLILAAAWLLRAESGGLRMLLEPWVASRMPVLAILSERRTDLATALQQRWPEIPHHWCLGPYLR